MGVGHSSTTKDATSVLPNGLADAVVRSGWEAIAYCWMPGDDVIEAVATVHDVEPREYVGVRSAAAGREMAARLCRRLTSVTLAQTLPAGHNRSAKQLAD